MPDTYIHPPADPEVAGIVGQGANYDAVATFNATYRLADLRRDAEAQLQGYDLLLVPTTPTMHTIEAVNADPVRLNSQLGYYTNFVNFFDMAALAVPADARADGKPAGVTLIAPAGGDQRLAAAAQALLSASAGAVAVVATKGIRAACATMRSMIPMAAPIGCRWRRWRAMFKCRWWQGKALR